MELECGHGMAVAGCATCGPMPTRDELAAAIREGRAGITSDAAIRELGLSDDAGERLVRVSPVSINTLDAFAAAARALKAAEEALVAARQAYAEAVKAMSEEAVR